MYQAKLSGISASWMWKGWLSDISACLMLGKCIKLGVSDISWMWENVSS